MKDIPIPSNPEEAQILRDHMKKLLKNLDRAVKRWLPKEYTKDFRAASTLDGLMTSPAFPDAMRRIARAAEAELAKEKSSKKRKGRRP